MSTPVNDLLNAILNDKPTEVKAAFDSAIQDRIADITSDMKQAQAETILDPADAASVVEPAADTEFDPAILDDFSQEELDAINNMTDAEWDQLIADIEAEGTEETNG